MLGSALVGKHGSPAEISGAPPEMLADSSVPDFTFYAGRQGWLEFIT
jgi:hypothetical protein